MRRADLADLTAFVAVADNLSFRAAASRLGVTPSALRWYCCNACQIARIERAGAAPS
jgi:hypothetical protein